MMILLQRLAGWLAPDDCLGCGLQGEALCGDCRIRLVQAKKPSCFRCSRPTADFSTCQRCRPETPVKRVVVAAEYDGAIKRLLIRFKFGQASDLASGLAALLHPYLDAGRYDLVTNVPVTAARLQQRGYDQAGLLARHLARRLGLPYRALLGRLGERHQLGAVLGRLGEHHQLGAGRQERLRNLAETMYLRGGPDRVADKRILLIDDVVTTGATLHECADVLAAAGAARLEAGVLAKN